MAGRETHYAPEVVALLDDPDFYQEIRQCLVDSRRQAYLEAYLREKQQCRDPGETAGNGECEFPDHAKTPNLSHS